MGSRLATTINQNFRIMKCIKFYHKDLESNLVEMVGMDSVMPIDGRLSLRSIRTKAQERVKKMENIKGFDHCAFSILTGVSLLNASESELYAL